MLERPKYQSFTGSVALMEPSASSGECAGEDPGLAKRRGGTDTTDTTVHSGPLTPTTPCTVCTGAERWDDAGVWRCITCWPMPLTVTARRAEKRYQALRQSRKEG